MKLWLIKFPMSRHDVYTEAVVAAKTPLQARRTHPDGSTPAWTLKKPWRSNDTWPNDPDLVDVRCIGTAAASVRKGVVCASFNAG